MNNLKAIRRLFGATQDEVGRAIGVNRVTIAKWEGGFSRPTSQNLKKMAIFFRIDASYFYEREPDRTVRQAITAAGEAMRAAKREEEGKRKEIDELAVLMAPVGFADVEAQYRLSLKLLTAHAEEATLGQLRTVYALHNKMGAVLAALLHAAQSEAEAASERQGMPLYDLIDNEE